MNDEMPFIKGVLPQALHLCFGCGYHVFYGTKTCPHCGADVQALVEKHNDAVRSAREALAKLEAIMKRLGEGVTEQQ